jgi:hypothetical protein
MRHALEQAHHAPKEHFARATHVFQITQQVKGLKPMAKLE